VLALAQPVPSAPQAQQCSLRANIFSTQIASGAALLYCPNPARADGKLGASGELLSSGTLLAHPGPRHSEVL
jgi:hypothetical protein